jgi:hypothetical protein
LLSGVRRLVENDDIELLAGMAEDIAAIGAVGAAESAQGDAAVMAQDLFKLLPSGYTVAAIRK